MDPSARARHPAHVWVGALVLLLALLTGCRSDSLVEDGQGSEDFAVQMVAGTRMTFNYWLLDRFGARINN